MSKKNKMLLSIVIPIVIVFGVAIGVMTHFYNFPTWTDDVKDMALAYLAEQEEIVLKYGEDAKLTYNGMNYNTKTKDSVVKIKIGGEVYLVTVDCVAENEYVVIGYERAENSD